MFMSRPRAISTRQYHDALVRVFIDFISDLEFYRERIKRNNVSALHR